MNNQILLPQEGVRAKKIWRTWKWAGLVVYALALLLSRWLPGPVLVAAYLYGIVVIVNLLVHLFIYLKNRFFWRVRNRIIGAFVFVGVIPLLLLLGVVYLSAYVLFGQLAGKYLSNALQETEHEISTINEELAVQLSAKEGRAAFAEAAARVFDEHAARFPTLEARLLRRLPDGGFEVLWTHDPRNLLPKATTHPAGKWLNGGPSFEGLLLNGRSVLMASLWAVPGPGDYYSELIAPLDEATQALLQREKSIYFTVIGAGRTSVTASKGGTQITISDSAGGPKQRDFEAEQGVKSLEQRRKNDGRRMVSWGMLLTARGFDTGKKVGAGVAILHVPLETVYKTYLGQGDFQGEVLIKVVFFLSGLFLVAELVSVIVGITISRRITRSVHDMYQGTLALQKGELQHQIPVRRHDQLGLLAHSFNQMSASITRLLEEVSEKKRLEQELEIAREVQATLFPKQLPHPRGMSVFGGCEPARVVSGDYYDFIVEDEIRLDIVVGDISGKGISAALLMANLQAVMRNQLLSLKQDDPENIERSLAAVMAQLNEQIYLNSPTEKYATLFLSRYNAETRKLSYCNAGHLPPIILSNHERQSLEPTGMVVGLFPGVEYQAKSVELTPGTLLAIFTDGVTEAVNQAGDEFGEARLLDALKASRSRSSEGIYRFVVERIREWQGDLPQHDDITLIIAKMG